MKTNHIAPDSQGSLKNSNPDRLLRAANGRLGRNEACWCGSGKKYKRCHLNRKPLREGLPKLSTRVTELARLCGIDNAKSIDDARKMVTLAALAWNLSRMKPGEWKAALRQSDWTATGLRDDFVTILEPLVLFAATYKNDQRICLDFELFPTSNGFQIVTSSMVPGDATS